MPLEEKEWTIMFFFASDNPLAPEIVSQLKAIKQAGFHPDANVIAQFDPHTQNTPTHVFDINRILKIEAEHDADAADYKIGYAGEKPDDPFVVNVMLDKVWGDEEEDREVKQQIREMLKEAAGKLMQPRPPEPDKEEEGGAAVTGNGTPPAARAPRGSDRDAAGDKRKGRRKEPPPMKSLRAFLSFCAEHYPARHYALLILGHGVVVGNDIFLFDENAAEPSLSLKQLREVLEDFNGAIKAERKEAPGAKESALELLGFHSCSMSSLEVAYELEGLTNYMLASQGPAFVGSWPYRHILIRVFNDLAAGRAKSPSDIRQMFENIFDYCYYNSYDFLVAGYSFDLCLCDLRAMKAIKQALPVLAAQLKGALASHAARERILLAHWDAQSFWDEGYIDLYDFCLCLQRRCTPDGAGDKAKPGEEVKLLDESLRPLFKACGDVRTALTSERRLRARRRAARGDDEFESAAAANPSSAKGVEVLTLMQKAFGDEVRAETEDEAPAEGTAEGTGAGAGQDPAGQFIVCSRFAGPLTQYSHGMTVFFPWAEPMQDGFMKHDYKEFRFVKDYGGSATTWHDFLMSYFELTCRKTRAAEEGKKGRGRKVLDAVVERFAELGVGDFAQLSKPGPDASTGAGDGVGFSVVKNYPRRLRERKKKEPADTKPVTAPTPAPEPEPAGSGD